MQNGSSKFSLKYIQVQYLNAMTYHVTSSQNRNLISEIYDHVILDLTSFPTSYVSVYIQKNAARIALQ
jgi:hypothetical protein